MRHHLAKLVGGVLVGGCSLIYNPNNIDRPPVDSNDTVDVEIRADSMPADLELTEAFPTTIDEGTGTGGSRAAVVVLRGKQFVKDPAGNLTVMLSPASAGAATLDSFEVAGNGDYIALAITAPIATSCNEGTSVDLGITVMQGDGMGGTVMKSLDTVSVRCLDELDAAPASANDLDALYSRIEIAGALDLPAAVAAPALLRSASSITIGGVVDADAAGREPGPGGGRGGEAGTLTVVAGAGQGVRPGGGGTGTLGAGGGGGGLVIAGTAGGGSGGAGGGVIGDPWISKYTDNRASGGGGGAPTTVLTGGPGGGGGGTIELTAPGDITVGDVNARGGAGGNGAAGDGGAGTGGIVLVRAGNMLTMGTVSVAAGGKTGNGGASSAGRVRIDAAKGTYPTGATECVAPVADPCSLAKGPMFVDLPVRTTVQMETIVLRGTPLDMTATLQVFDKDQNVVGGEPYAPSFGGTGGAMVPVVLKAGYNNVCVWVQNGVITVPESTNCTAIAYLPP